MSGCPLGLEFCDQKPISLDAKCYAVTCENYFYCFSWVKSWNLPLHRINYENDPVKFAAVGHDYYLVEFLCGYGYPGEAVEGMQDRDWATYFAEYGYAEAVPLPTHHSYLSRLKSLFDFEEVVNWKPRRLFSTLPNGMIIVRTIFDGFITLRRPRD